MKLFIAGDSWSETGPANVTYNLIKELPKETLSLATRNKFTRFIEIIFNTLKADIVVYSGFSVQNLFGFFLAKLFHKTSYYIMHGSVDFEGRINCDWNYKMVMQEKKMLKNANYILAVSELFAEWLKKEYPEYDNKIYFLANGINWDIMPQKINGIKRNTNQLLSIGGGMPRKNILSICKAVNKLYQEDSTCKIRLVVLGNDGKDSSEIKKYHFVDYRGILSHEETIKIMLQSKLFIQNSSFETFGLAPIEALICGCDILLSENVGAISIIDGLIDNDIIKCYTCVDEIKEKIAYGLECSNQQRLINSINKSKTSTHNRAMELLKIIKRLEGNQVEY